MRKAEELAQKLGKEIESTVAHDMLMQDTLTHLRALDASHQRLEEALEIARDALGQLILAGKAAKETLDTDIPLGDPVHPVSAKLTWPLSTALMAEEKLHAALEQAKDLE